MILLAVDIQKGITDERLYAYEEFTGSVRRLIDEARKAGVEVVHVRHDDGKGSGFTVGDEAFEIDGRFAPVSGEKVFDKDVNYIDLPYYMANRELTFEEKSAIAFANMVYYYETNQLPYLYF